jgi:outer membrane immunogenic protein
LNRTGDEKETGAGYVGGRIGYLVTPTLLTYFDGGWTETRFEQVNYSLNGFPPLPPTGESLPATTYHGWFLGGGTEYALNFDWLPIHGLFWRTEYRYASYEAKDVPIANSILAPGLAAEHERKYVQTITSSLVWRFNATAAETAGAAHMPLKAPPSALPLMSWTGCNVNGGVGYGMWNQVQHSEIFGVETSIDMTNGGRGWLGRIGGGCDYQMGGDLSRWVVGAFGDYDFMSFKGTSEFPSNPVGGVAINVAGDEKETGAWYVGGRIGYLVTPTLLTYFDGGWTETRFDQVNYSLTGIPSVSTNVFLPATTYHGGFLGGGTEYALNFSWLPIHGLFWRNEYRFASYRAKDILVVNAEFPGGGEHERKYMQTITSSLVWRFN